LPIYSPYIFQAYILSFYSANSFLEMERILISSSSNDESSPISRRVPSPQQIPRGNVPAPMPPNVNPLRYVFPRTVGPERNPRYPALAAYPARDGPRSNLDAFPDANSPLAMDLDAACFLMLSRDLPELFGVMGRPANRQVKVKDLDDFNDWVHVISDPIVVKGLGFRV
jgi:hypothetical protein